MAQRSYVEKDYTRDTAYIEDRITSDGSSDWPVEPGRYRLVVSRACPWANRAIIVRRLLGLEDVISMGITGPTHDADSWTFDLDPDHLDPVLQIPRLKDAYEKRFPGYPKGITVPAIVDVPTGAVVTNDFPPTIGGIQSYLRDFISTLPRRTLWCLPPPRTHRLPRNSTRAWTTPWCAGPGP